MCVVQDFQPALSLEYSLGLDKTLTPTNEVNGAIFFQKLKLSIIVTEVLIRICHCSQQFLLMPPLVLEFLINVYFITSC